MKSKGVMAGVDAGGGLSHPLTVRSGNEAMDLRLPGDAPPTSGTITWAHFVHGLPKL
jgi:hypothetical protein